MPKKGRRSIGQRAKYWHKKVKAAAVVNSTCEPTEDHSYADYLNTCDTTATTRVTSELQDSDGFWADDFYVIVDYAYQYDPSVNLDVFVFDIKGQIQNSLLSEVKDANLFDFHLVPSRRGIRLVQLYEDDGVKTSVVLSPNFEAIVCVHGLQIAYDHDLWSGLPNMFFKLSSVFKLLKKMNTYFVCPGNTDEKFQSFVSVGIKLSNDMNSKLSAYKEGDKGASVNGTRYHSSIRTFDCELLCKGNRCKKCSVYRGALRKMASRDQQKNDVPDIKSSKKPLASMSKEELILKCRQLKSYSNSLEKTLERLKGAIKLELQKCDTIGESVALDITSIAQSHSQQVEEAFPDPYSFQRLFWDEQLKFNQCKDKRSMRWHPMMIKWCLHLQSKSASTYDALRESGFIKLPSTRTLFDYSHYIVSGTGFFPEIIVEQLHRELKLKNLNEDWQKYVGILFDEVKIKKDLVYDKHSGELVGFLNLDDVGNDLVELESIMNNSSSAEATHVLVLMVRGIATSLRFPLAHFATKSISADFIYSIIQQAVEILEIDVDLKVLFVTCDGASANRCYFQLHKLPSDSQDTIVHYACNPYDLERKIFFISDPPHLLKTTRNCFANSMSHKNSRKLWNGQDISWMHVVRLFEDHCSGLYRLAPKLTLSHINLTAFSCMKVNLAAQVLSDTVANALEISYGEEVKETVEFIRVMNKFFDCLNTRNLHESKATLNTDKSPYTAENDPRLDWLLQDFLPYFKNWQSKIEHRNGDFTKKQKDAMCLSHQTLAGLEITVKSVVSCVKYLLSNNVPFVLTQCFNQDPLEQHFGIHRQRCGGNTNPTVYEFNHNMTRLRSIGSEALAPIRGNTKRGERKHVVNNEPLPKRMRLHRL